MATLPRTTAIFALSIFMLCRCQPAEQPRPYVILISFDGFRHDYVAKYQPPHFLELIGEGASADKMLPSFPSKTFPNHYTLVTGLYPGHHGLVDNTFYDPARKETYTIGNRALVEDPYYYGGTPLWQLAQQHGLKSASYFWVGSEAPIGGSFPDYYKIYDGAVPNESRIGQVMNWLSLPEPERPHFISLYFSLVDDEGHSSGPNSEQLRETVLEADRLLGLVMEGLKATRLPVNVIVTSDHGMLEMTEQPETFVYLEDLLNPADSVVVANSGAVLHVYEKDSLRRLALMNRFKGMEQHFKTYRREDTPEQWHYRQHDRIGGLVLVIAPGHYFTSRSRKNDEMEADTYWGAHGFDPYATPEMGAIFYAWGPNISKGARIGGFENVHVYPLITHILGLEAPAGIDGRLEVLLPLYKK